MSNELAEERRTPSDATNVCYYGNGGRVRRFTDSDGNLCFNIGTEYHNQTLFWADFQQIVKYFAVEFIEKGSVRP